MVTLPDEIDLANADQVGREIDAALMPGAATVVADMTATRFCDTVGTRALVLACQHATGHGCELRLLRPSARVMQVWKSWDCIRCCRSITARTKPWQAQGNDDENWRFR